MQQTTLTIPVKTDAPVNPEEIATIVQRLIDIGLADAAATIEDKGNCDEGDIKAAALASNLYIGPAAVATEICCDAAVIAAESLPRFPLQGNLKLHEIAQVVVFTSGGIVNSVAIRDLPKNAMPCIVVDYDDRHDEDGDTSPEDFERKKIGVSREEFDKSAKYIF